MRRNQSSVAKMAKSFHYFFDTTDTESWFTHIDAARRISWLILTTLIVACIVCVASRRAGALPPMADKPKGEDILNAIIPPREWIQNGKSKRTILHSRQGRNWVTKAGDLKPSCERTAI